MSNALTLDDLSSEYKAKVYLQDYSKKETIEGVQLISLKSYPAEEGDFSELMRINSHGELQEIPGFKIAQINRTTLFPHSIKAWHLHLKQDEIWYVPPLYHLVVGLWDLRKHSKTCHGTMRIPLGLGTSSLLFIPKGVAHGSMVLFPQPIELFYFVNQLFNKQDPDERRIPWDSLGASFWKPQRD